MVSAIPVANYWNLETGDRVDDPNVFVWACTNAVIAKCVLWGYRPWATAKRCKDYEKGKQLQDDLAAGPPPGLHAHGSRRLLRQRRAVDGQRHRDRPVGPPLAGRSRSARPTGSSRPSGTPTGPTASATSATRSTRSRGSTPSASRTSRASRRRPQRLRLARGSPRAARQRVRQVQRRPPRREPGRRTTTMTTASSWLQGWSRRSRRSPGHGH